MIAFRSKGASCDAASMFAVALVCLLGGGEATKDDSYYPNGIYNPNIDSGMYWQDARNVIQDLSLFQSLSVKYHSCAWSEITDGDDDGGGGGGEDDSWYYGSVRPYGANVAYSLYGSLLGTSQSGCSRKTYINSFYTTAGFTAFSNSMAAAGIDGFVYQDGSGDGGNDDDAVVVYSVGCSSDDDSGDNGDDDGSASSFGVSCTNKGNFAVFEYSGAYCLSNQVVNVSDWMVDYNANLKEAASCVEIYNADASDDDHNSGEQSGSMALLEQSAACSLDDIGGACPDPYWKLKSYARILRHATGTEDQRAIIRNEMVGAAALLFSSLALFVGSIIAVRRTLSATKKLSVEQTTPTTQTKAGKKSRCRSISKLFKSFPQRSKNKKAASVTLENDNVVVDATAVATAVPLRKYATYS